MGNSAIVNMYVLVQPCKVAFVCVNDTQPSIPGNGMPMTPQVLGAKTLQRCLKIAAVQRAGGILSHSSGGFYAPASCLMKR